MITQDRATEVASAAFTASGRIPAEFDLTLEDGDAGKQWWVWFEQKGAFRAPGGKHLVKVDKATGDAVFMPGE